MSSSSSSDFFKTTSSSSSTDTDFASQPSPPQPLSNFLPQPFLNFTSDDQFQGTVKFTHRESQLVGKDCYYAFGKNLQLIDGSYLKVVPSDFICKCLLIASEDDGYRVQLPSSLFKQARNGDEIRFRKDNTTYSLQLDRNFEYEFAQIEENTSQVRFLCNEDIPDEMEGYSVWLDGQLKISLSSEAKYVVLIRNGAISTVPVSHYNRYLSDYNFQRATQFHSDKELTFQMPLCEKDPNIEVILDEHFMYVLIQHPKRKQDLIDAEASYENQLADPSLTDQRREAIERAFAESKERGGVSCYLKRPGKR